MAYDYGRYLLQLARQKPSKLLKSVKTESKYKSIHQKLVDLYVNLCASSTNHEFSRSNLLRLLVAKEKLNCLVVNLYPGNDGYSIMLKTRAGYESETACLPYEENEFLEYIDNEELPPLLIDLLGRSQINVFYSGCVVVEVRDYRRSTVGAFESYFVLLKPTAQSIICDVAVLANENQRYSWEELQALESNLLIYTAEPLCLDPSVSVAVVANHLQHSRKILSRNSVKKVAMKSSPFMVQRRRKWQQYLTHPTLKLYDFLCKRRKPSSKPLCMKISASLDEFPIKDNFRLNTADLALVQKSINSIVLPKRSTDTDPVLVEEYIMEIERNPGKIHCTKVTITQTPADEQYYGTLCLSREDFDDNATCSFTLGSRSEVDKYINQFTEIFTEEGRKSVKTTHIVPGKEPEIIFTPGAKEMMGNNQSSATNSTSLTTAASATLTTVTSSSPPKLSSSFTVESIMSSVNKSDVSEETKTLGLPFRTADSQNDNSVSAIQHFQYPIPSSVFPMIQDLAVPDPTAALSGAFAPVVTLAAPNLSLQNIVSIAGMSTNQTITVPISLAVVNSSQSAFLSPASRVMVGSVPSSSLIADESVISPVALSCDLNPRIKTEP